MHELAEHLKNKIGQTDHLSNLILHCFHSDYGVFYKHAVNTDAGDHLCELAGESNLVLTYKKVRSMKSDILCQFGSYFKIT